MQRVPKIANAVGSTTNGYDDWQLTVTDPLGKVKNYTKDAYSKLLPGKSAREDGLISAKFLFDKRDVLYSKIRPNLRKAAIPDGRGLCSADMYPLRPGSRLLREFLWAYLLTDDFTNRAVDLSARANMPKLNRVQLNSIESPVPPLTLQNEFAQRVMGVRELEAEQVSSRQRLDDLFQSMLQRAFGGEL